VTADAALATAATQPITITGTVAPNQSITLNGVNYTVKNVTTAAASQETPSLSGTVSSIIYAV
jgi:hypothetical protein